MSWISFFVYLLLIDALLANWMAFSNRHCWWRQHLGRFGQHFPLARGWTVYYLILALVIAWLVYRTGELAVPF